jgi:hypothetical protein
MKLKFSFIGLIAFLSLIFLLHEAHDNAHFLAAAAACNCWGEKGFDAWTFFEGCVPSHFQQCIIFLSGPMINNICLIIAWTLMRRANEVGKQSVGFCLLFASLPLMRLIAAAQGGGDETSAIRQVLLKGGQTTGHIPAFAGLALVSLFCLPVMVRAFFLLKGWLQRLIVFPIFLVLPLLADKWAVAGVMANLLKTGFLDNEGLPGTPLLVIIWTLAWLIVLLLSYKKLVGLFRPSF